MDRMLKYFLVYFAWVFVLFVFIDRFVAGAFGFEIIRAITRTVVWYRIIIGLLGVVGLWYAVYDRLIVSKGTVNK